LNREKERGLEKTEFYIVLKSSLVHSEQREESVNVSIIKFSRHFQILRVVQNGQIFDF